MKYYLLKEYKRKGKYFEYITLKKELLETLNSQSWYCLSTKLLNEDKEFVIGSIKDSYVSLSIELKLSELAVNHDTSIIEKQFLYHY